MESPWEAGENPSLETHPASTAFTWFLVLCSCKVVSETGSFAFFINERPQSVAGAHLLTILMLLAALRFLKKLGLASGLRILNTSETALLVEAIRVVHSGKNLDAL